MLFLIFLSLWTSTWVWSTYQGTTLIGKNDLTSTRNHQLWQSPLPRVRLSAHLHFTYWYLVWLKISQVVCDGVTTTKCLYIRSFPAVSTRHHFLIVIYPLWPLHCFYFLFLNDAWTLGVTLVWYECPIQGWIFHSVYQLQREDSLIRTVKRTNLSL